MKKIALILLFVSVLIVSLSCDKSLITTNTTIASTSTTNESTTSFVPTTTIEPITTETDTTSTIITTTNTTTEGFITCETCDVYNIPDIDVVKTKITENTFQFELDYVEAGCMGYIDEMYIYEKNSLNKVFTFTNFDQPEFDANGLESRTDYTLRIEYKFGIEGYLTSMVFLYGFRTDSGISVEANNIISTTDSFSFDLNIIDPDSVVYISSISVTSDGRRVGYISEIGPYELNGLDPYTRYKVEVLYTYPLRNYSNYYEDETLTIWITTLPDFPIITIQSIETTESTFDFEIDIYDPDSLITIDLFSLYQGETLIYEDPNPQDITDQYRFTDLNSSTEYIIKITYHYDDGDGMETVNYDYTFYTMEPHPMDFHISNTLNSHDTLSFNIDFTANFGDLIVYEVNLYLDNTLVESKLNPGLDFTFSNLETNTTYVLEVIVGYDCTDEIWCDYTYAKESTFTTE